MENNNTEMIFMCVIMACVIFMTFTLIGVKSELSIANNNTYQLSKKLDGIRCDTSFAVYEGQITMREYLEMNPRCKEFINITK